MRVRPPRPHVEDASFLELARAEPKVGRRTLIAVYRKEPCSGATRSILTDENGAFLGSLAPGEGALLDLSDRTRTIFVVSRVELDAPRGTWSTFMEVTVPRANEALVLSALRHDARQCSSGKYAQVSIASKEELERILADAPVKWLTPDVRAGEAWLDARRGRLDEILGRNREEVRIVRRVNVP